MRSLLTLSLLFGFISLAQAHAFLDEAEPKVGSTVNVPPAVVKIWFTKQIVRDGSNIEVFDAQGAEVDLKDDKTDPADGFLLTVSVPKLAVGSYKVVWNAVCRDTHHTTGSFVFNVAATTAKDGFQIKELQTRLSNLLCFNRCSLHVLLVFL